MAKLLSGMGRVQNRRHVGVRPVQRVRITADHDDDRIRVRRINFPDQLLLGFRQRNIRTVDRFLPVDQRMVPDEHDRQLGIRRRFLRRLQLIRHDLQFELVGVDDFGFRPRDFDRSRDIDLVRRFRRPAVADQ
ncbi:hypothetical protein D1872_295430 [compost metagenome]